VLLIFCAFLILLFGFEPELLVNAVTMALAVR
jgi:NADH-quinone oxidoreductase subunit N